MERMNPMTRDEAKASEMSKYKARKLIKELKKEVGRLNRVIEVSTESKKDNLALIKLMEDNIIK